MKKKLFIAIATGVFMIAMMVNLSVAQRGNVENLTIGSLATIAQAQTELPEVSVCAAKRWVTISEENGIRCQECKWVQVDCSVKSEC